MTKKTTSYTLKQFDAKLWNAFKAKCASNGKTILKRLTELIQNDVGVK